jgi:C1A family cysteine protease
LYKVTTTADVEEGSTSQLKASISTNGPTSVAVEADAMAFQLYHSGVITADCGDNLDHAVLATGYGTEKVNDADVDYFLVKNSWGGNWGENGYVKVGTNNQCGICDMASTITGATDESS